VAEESPVCTRLAVVLTILADAGFVKTTSKSAAQTMRRAESRQPVRIVIAPGLRRDG
jgi:hypothetical protein